MNAYEQMQLIKHLMNTGQWASDTLIIAELKEQCAYKGCEEKATHILYSGDNVLQDDSINVVCEEHATGAKRAIEKQAKSQDRSISVDIFVPENAKEDMEAGR